MTEKSGRPHAITDEELARLDDIIAGYKRQTGGTSAWNPKDGLGPLGDEIGKNIVEYLLDFDERHVKSDEVLSYLEQEGLEQEATLKGVGKRMRMIGNYLEFEEFQAFYSKKHHLAR